MPIVRFSASHQEGVQAYNLETVGSREALSYLMARSGIIPQTMPPDELMDKATPSRIQIPVKGASPWFRQRQTAVIVSLNSLSRSPKPSLKRLAA